MAEGIENSLCEAIELIVDKAVKTAGYDKTIQATVIECVDETIGKYKVRFQDATFFAYTVTAEVYYPAGCDVYVLVPGNDMTREKTILGATKKLGIDYASVPVGEEAFSPVGINTIISRDSFGLISYNGQTIIEVYKKNGNNNLITIDTTAVERYIHESSSILCGATFKTALPTEQQYKGTYGICYELNFLDNATSKVVTKNYIVDVNFIEGNPYRLTHDKRAYGIFEIDANNFVDINRVYLFCKDFPNTKPNQPEDIFIKNLELTGMVPLSAAELAAGALTFITPRGTYFDVGDLDSDYRQIQAQVRVRGKIMDSNSPALEYYWFREDVTITNASPWYNKYGGQGWRCLNSFNILEGTVESPSVVEWIPGSYEYRTMKKDNPAKETRYKCIVIYNGKALAKEISIMNYASSWDITIESDAGTKFYYDIGTPTLTCLINNVEKADNAFQYHWSLVDSNGNFSVLIDNPTISLDVVESFADMHYDTQVYILNNDRYIYYYNQGNWEKTILQVDLDNDTDNTIYNNAAAAYEQYKTGVQNEIYLPAATQPILDGLKKILDTYNSITRVEKHKIHKVQANTIMKFATYKCSVYHNGIFIGTGSTILTNEFDANAYTLVIHNGAQTFKYDEDGIAPTNKAFANPYIIPALTFDIYDNLGNPLAEEIIRTCKIRWIVPNINTLLTIGRNDYPSPSSNIDNTELYYDNLMTFTYGIQDRYNVSKRNNNISLQVQYKDMVLSAHTNFTFAKEGEPGTNGTEYLCRIVPNSTDNLNGIVPMILNGRPNFTVTGGATNKKWFNVELWHNGQKIYPSTAGTNITSEGKTISTSWSILKNKYTSSISDNSDLSITISGEFTYNGYSIKGDTHPANIVKCTINYEGVTYYATLPLITAQTNSAYEVGLIENTGFQFATYGSDGRRASYDNSNPFTLQVLKTINNVKEDISTLSTNNNKVAYTWKVLGRTYLNGTGWINSNLIIKNDKIEVERNQQSYKPADSYDNECVTAAVEATIKDANGITVGQIHIPIHLLLNKYGHKELNQWDGNSIQISQDGGFILAPEIGAGTKDNNNNFTGVLMGKVKEANHSKYYTGLHGYNKGVRTIFLNAENGSAAFGKTGTGQIIIDPSTNKGLIYSSSYWKNYGEDGLPTSYGDGNKAGRDGENQDAETGMLIDLTTPGIYFGNGNFSVDKYGKITAKGGGRIAGWNIDNENIYSNKSKADGRLTLNSTNQGKIYSHSHDTLTSTSTGFYISYDGISIGSKFKVTNTGVVTVGTGAVAGSNKHWEINGDNSNSYIKYGDKGTAGSVYIGTDAISLGTKFSVNNNGAMTSKSGTIGSWTINDSTLTTGNITLNSNGNIYCTIDGTQKWYINNNGSASFGSGNLKISKDGNVSIKNGVTELKSDGSFKSGNFSVDKNGNATFKGSITSGSTITGTEINNGNGTFKVDANGNLTATSVKITGGSVSGGIVTSGIKAGNITTGTLSADRIGAGSITGSKIAGKTITANKLSVDTLSAISADLGTITAGTINGGTINTENINLTGVSQITDKIHIYSATDFKLTLKGKGQAMGGYAITQASFELSGKYTWLQFKQGLLVSGAVDSTTRTFSSSYVYPSEG